MSKICDICNKGALTGNNIQHKQTGSWALKAPKTKKRSNPNLRNVMVRVGDDEKNSNINIKVCMKCYKKIRS